MQQRSPILPVDHMTMAIIAFLLTCSTSLAQPLCVIESQRILPPDSEAGDFFGLGVALTDDGTMLAVGAFQDSAPSLPGVQHGSVRIYQRDPVTKAWVFSQFIVPSDAGPGDYFGSSIDFSADKQTMVIGAQRDSNSVAVEAGAVYVFTWSGSAWIEQVKIVPP